MKGTRSATIAAEVCPGREPVENTCVEGTGQVSYFNELVAGAAGVGRRILGVGRSGGSSSDVF